MTNNKNRNRYNKINNKTTIKIKQQRTFNKNKSNKNRNETN